MSCKNVLQNKEMLFCLGEIRNILSMRCQVNKFLSSIFLQKELLYIDGLKLDSNYPYVLNIHSKLSHPQHNFFSLPIAGRTAVELLMSYVHQSTVKETS